MATKEQIDALEIGDKLEFELSPGEWHEVVLADVTHKTDKPHVQLLVERWGYARLRLPSER